MDVAAENRYRPWPLGRLREALCSGDMLWELCRPKSVTNKHDVREIDLETLAETVMVEHFGRQRVTLRRSIGSTLGLRSAPFPARALPDIVVNLDGALHVCELKSSRTDYSRFDCVFTSRPFKTYLASLGHDGAPPWEVEQDLIKLRLFAGLSRQVRSCLFVMVDASAGSGRSWGDVFADTRAFRSTMRTNLVRGWTEELLAATTIAPISAAAIQAKLIVCEVRPTAG